MKSSCCFAANTGGMKKRLSRFFTNKNHVKVIHGRFVAIFFNYVPCRDILLLNFSKLEKNLTSFFLLNIHSEKNCLKERIFARQNRPKITSTAATICGRHSLWVNINSKCTKHCALNK